MLVDTHAHLDSKRFAGDREAVITRALEAGVGAIVTVGADMASSRAAVGLAQQHPNVYATVGVHPHDARDVEPDDLAELARLGSEPVVVAIGEIGLDFYRNLSPPERQREAFIAQLDLARQAAKPVVIHDRDAHREVMSILKDKADGLKGVLHCFSGDLALAREALEMGWFVSLAGPVTFRNARKLQELARRLPLDGLLVETDCPFLAPHPYRGKRNEPAYVRLVAEKISALKELPLQEVAAATTRNASQLFGLSGVT
jgi:TatD DNase family protein